MLTSTLRSLRCIENTQLDGCSVSTVFLGLDHRFSDVDSNTPIIFETLVFNGEFNGEMERYTTVEAAKQGHAIMVAKVLQGK